MDDLIIMEMMRVPKLISLNYSLDIRICKKYSYSFLPVSASLVLCPLNVTCRIYVLGFMFLEHV